MNGTPIGYALARVHARHALRPLPAEWHRLDGARTAAQYLHFARKTGLRHWLRSINEEEAQTTAELTLRDAFRRHTVEVAGWLPATAQPAARHTGRLIDLPALAHLHTGGQAQHWMDDDPVLAPLVNDSAPATDMAAPIDAWLKHWLALCPGPRHDNIAARLGGALLGLVTTPQTTFAAHRLHWLFRTHALDSAGVYAYLGLVLDDLLRLAGGLARRRPGQSRFEEAA